MHPSSDNTFVHRFIPLCMVVFLSHAPFSMVLNNWRCLHTHAYQFDPKNKTKKTHVNFVIVALVTMLHLCFSVVPFEPCLCIFIRLFGEASSANMSQFTLLLVIIRKRESVGQERDRQTDRQTDRHRQTETETERQGETQRERWTEKSSIFCTVRHNFGKGNLVIVTVIIILMINTFSLKSLIIIMSTL